MKINNIALISIIIGIAISFAPESFAGGAFSKGSKIKAQKAKNITEALPKIRRQLQIDGSHLEILQIIDEFKDFREELENKIGKNDPVSDDEIDEYIRVVDQNIKLMKYKYIILTGENLDGTKVSNRKLKKAIRVAAEMIVDKPVYKIPDSLSRAANEAHDPATQEDTQTIISSSQSAR